MDLALGGPTFMKENEAKMGVWSEVGRGTGVGKSCYLKLGRKAGGREKE